MSKVPRAAMKPVETSLVRQLLGHKTLYNTECVPFFKTLHPHTFSSCLGLSPTLSELVIPKDGKAKDSMQQVIRELPSNAPEFLEDQGKLVQTGLEALQWMQHVRKRLDVTDHKSFTDVPYEFEVGDVVRHKQLGQLGVIAARLPICFASDEWLVDNLGSATDVRLHHPWYLVLVSHHRGLPLDFTRYGSQMTHEKVEKPTSIGMNRNLPMFFKGYDAEKGVYIPRRRPTPVTAPQASQETNSEPVHLHKVNVTPKAPSATASS